MKDKKHSLKDIYIRVADINQIPKNLEKIKGVIVPISEITQMDEKIIVEIPRWINNTDYVIERLKYFKETKLKKLIVIIWQLLNWLINHLLK